MIARRLIWPMLLIGWSLSCQQQAPNRSLTVTATAYNSTLAQTNAQPGVTAFGDTLLPGVKAIAVSRDLLDSGLTYGTEVRIDSLPGTYRVMDKMNRRWRRKIDIYMGMDEAAARDWGKRRVIIHWRASDSTTQQ